MRAVIEDAIHSFDGIARVHASDHERHLNFGDDASLAGGNRRLSGRWGRDNPCALYERI